MSARPWSPAEVEAEIPVVLEQLDDAVTEVRDSARLAAEATRDFKKERALATLQVSGKNAEERQARIHLHQITPGGKTVGDLEYEADLAEGVNRSAGQAIRVLQSRADLLRSLLASHRSTRA